MERGALWATIHRVAKSQPRLKRLSLHTHTHTGLGISPVGLTRVEWVFIPLTASFGSPCASAEKETSFSPTLNSYPSSCLCQGWQRITIQCSVPQHRKEVKGRSEVAQSCPTLCDPMNCSLPGSSVHGILQARILEWVAISFSRRPSWPRDWTQVSCIVGRCFTIWATREIHTIFLTGKYPERSLIWWNRGKRWWRLRWRRGEVRAHLTYLIYFKIFNNRDIVFSLMQTHRVKYLCVTSYPLLKIPSLRTSSSHQPQHP